MYENEKVGQYLWTGQVGRASKRKMSALETYQPEASCDHPGHVIYVTLTVSIWSHSVESQIEEEYCQMMSSVAR